MPKRIIHKGYNLDICDKLIAGIVRAFWRRIEPYKNNYGRELPDTVPVEFMAHMGTALIMLDRFPPTLEIELGHGDKLVTDFYDHGGQWAGIAISNGECPVGDICDTGANEINELEPLLKIITSNPESLDVIIASCERAKKHLEQTNQGGEE